MRVLLGEKSHLQSVLKSACFEQSSTLVVKLQNFSDYESKVLRLLDEWECRVLEYSELSGQYESTLDENRKIFLSLKCLVKDKDTLIGKLQGQLKAKN
jgi:hypothetical protein